MANITPGSGVSNLVKAGVNTYRNLSSMYNQGKATATKYSPGRSTSDILAQMRASRAETDALLKQISNMNRTVYAPDLNLDALYAKSRKEAAKAQNPYYNTELNRFLKEQAFQKKTREQQSTMDVKNLDDELSNTLQTNQITGERTAEDTATNIDKINTQADEFQTDTGEEFDIERIAQARVQAQAGLTGGIGSQANESAQMKRNTGEKRQMVQTEEAKIQQNLAKARTFQDLERSGEQAKSSTAKGKKQIKFDLDTFIKQQGFDKGTKKRQLQKEKKGAIIEDASRRAAQKVNKFIMSISDPAKRDAARRAYGGIYG